MAFPAVAELLSQGFPTSATTHTVSLPATVNDGDLLLILFGSNRNITPPGSFTEKVSKDASSSLSTFSASAKVGVSGDSGTTVDFTLSDAWSAVAFVYRITGWSKDLAGVEGAFAATSLSLPSFNTSWSGEDTLWLGNIVAVDDDATVTGYPSGYINGQGIVSGAGLNAGCTLGTATQDSATQAAPSGSYTLSEGEVNATSVLAIRPESGVSLTAPASISPGTSGQFTVTGLAGAPTSATVSDGTSTLTLTNIALVSGDTYSFDTPALPAVGSSLQYTAFGSVTMTVGDGTSTVQDTTSLAAATGQTVTTLAATFDTSELSYLFSFSGTPATGDQFIEGNAALALDANGGYVADTDGTYVITGIDATDGIAQTFALIVGDIIAELNRIRSITTKPLTVSSVKARSLNIK